MKIHSVRTHNIRQFLGLQEIDFSTDDRRNVTLIHGQNTTGKTTFLNAIKWCLYGTFIKGFEEPDRLVSKQASGSEYGVTVAFSNDGKHYTARRYSNGRPSDGVLTLLVQAQSGRQIPVAEPQLLINQILPESLSPFFFFAGEMMADGHSAFRASSGTANAIRSVLGFTIAENAITDLTFVLKKKNSELATLSKGTDLGVVSDQIVQKTEKLDLVERQLNDARAAFKIYDEKKASLAEKLRNHETSSSIQQRRDRLEKRSKVASEQLGKAKKAWCELIASHGHTVFWHPVAADAVKYIDEAVTKRRIPSPYDKTFVSDLLTDRVCVCGRELVPGSAEFRSVSDLINDATDEQTIRRALAVRGVADRVNGLFNTTPKQLKRTLEAIRATSENLENAEQELARIRELMLRHEEQNVADMESELVQIDNQLVDFKVKVSRYTEDFETERATIAELKKQRDRAQAATPQVEAVKRSVDILSILVEKLKDELESAEETGLTQISSALNDVVGNSTRKKYIAEVGRDYAITLYEDSDTGGRRKVQVLSSGERRLLNLCFVSALVKVCRDRLNDKTRLLVPGAVAPLVIDAPFGELDPKYQALAVETMRKQCDQLVLLLSETHRTEEVDQAVRKFIGKEWILVVSQRSAAGGAADVETTINGRVYRQFLYSQPDDKTEFQPVARS